MNEKLKLIPLTQTTHSSNMEKTYTKYEKARILGARALQIAMNAPLLLAIPKEKLEEISFDPLKIAELEFNANILPITVRRPFPKKEEVEEETEEEEIIKEEEAPKPAEAAAEKPVIEEEKAEVVVEEPEEAP